MPVNFIDYLHKYDFIIVPFATDSLILNFHYKTDKFISLSEIFYQDTFSMTLNLRFNTQEEKSIKKFCINKQIAFVQLPNDYEYITNFFDDLKCNIIPLHLQAPQISSQIVCSDLLEEYHQILEYEDTSSKPLKAKPSHQHDMPFFSFSNKTDFMLGVDHPMLRQLFNDRCLVNVLWDTTFGQKIYRMARFLFYHDAYATEQDKELIADIEIKDIDSFESLRYYAPSLSHEALFAEQLKHMNCRADLIGSFMRFVTLYYKHVHVHYLSLLVAFLKHKYCLHADVTNPLYPIHVLRFFNKPLLLAGFLENDKYSLITAQTLRSGNPLYMIHTSLYIENIVQFIPVSHANLPLYKHDPISYIETPTDIQQQPLSSSSSPQQETTDNKITIYNIDDFLLLTEKNTSELFDQINDIYKLNGLLYRMFDDFIVTGKDQLPFIPKDLPPFAVAIIRDMYNSIINKYYAILKELHLTNYTAQKQYTELDTFTTLLPNRILLKSSHYCIITPSDIYIFLLSFSGTFTMTRKLLLQCYTAGMHYNTYTPSSTSSNPLSNLSQPILKHLIYINTSDYKELSWDNILKSCKNYIQNIFLN